jgi:hypothetical protein
VRTKRGPYSGLMLYMGTVKTAQEPAAPMIRYSAVAVLAVSTLLLAACSGGGGAGQPLVAATSRGAQVCVPAPNLLGDDIPAWNSPVGFALTWYYNASASPVEIESVSLIGSHNLVLHQAVVYEAEREQHQLILSDGWPLISTNSDPGGWARRQGVPGALVSPDPPGAGPTTHDAYEVVLDISAKTPAGGYAIGQQVTYRQGNAQYTIRSYSGYAISPPGTQGQEGGRCSAFGKAISAAWPSP